MNVDLTKQLKTPAYVQIDGEVLWYMVMLFYLKLTSCLRGIMQLKYCCKAGGNL